MTDNVQCRFELFIRQRVEWYGPEHLTLNMNYLLPTLTFYSTIFQDNSLHIIQSCSWVSDIRYCYSGHHMSRHEKSAKRHLRSIFCPNGKIYHQQKPVWMIGNKNSLFFAYVFFVVISFRFFTKFLHEKIWLEKYLN